MEKLLALLDILKHPIKSLQWIALACAFATTFLLFAPNKYLAVFNMDAFISVDERTQWAGLILITSISIDIVALIVFFTESVNIAVRKRNAALTARKTYIADQRLRRRQRFAEARLERTKQDKILKDLTDREKQLLKKFIESTILQLSGNDIDTATLLSAKNIVSRLRSSYDNHGNRAGEVYALVEWARERTNTSPDLSL
jgi:Sec-independent protein translocase protein TatA